MVTKSLMIYRFSKARRNVSILLIGLLVALLFGLWFKNMAENRGVYPSKQTFSKTVYGVNVDITAMIPDTPYTVRTASGGNFFDLAAQLGINTLRITDVRWASTGEVRSKTTWQYVFNEAASHHMNVILLLTHGGEPSAIKDAHILLEQYGLAYAPALWLIDLDNEPNVSDPQQMTVLREEAAYVHQVAPKVPVTIGGWESQVSGHLGEYDWQDPKDIPKLIDLVDVVSPHLYEFEQRIQQGFMPQQWTRRFLSEVRKQSQGKPILLEEFGAGNGLATTTMPTPTGSPQWQAVVYQEVLQEVSAEHNQGVIGAVAWIIAPRPAWPNSDNYQGNMAGWAFVLNHGRRLLPAAQEFSAVAHA